MENLENESRGEVFKREKSRSGFGFFLAIVIIVSIFISATFGAFFGFLASRSDFPLFSALGIKNFSGLFSQNQSGEPNITKQKIIQEDSAVIDVVQKSTPAVVSIVITKDVPKIQSFGSLPDFFGSPFDFYFGQGSESGNNSGGTQKQTIGGGSGFFITTDGMIITNRHVVDDASAEYTVVTNDNKEHPAKVLARNPINDLAVIKIDGGDYPTLALGNSDSVQIGQMVVAIGNSLGEFSNTVSRGIISGLKRNLTAGGSMGQSERLTNIVQTDAAINPGNSGGPLLDINGQVIGINVAIAQGAQNIGFAIPSNQAERMVNQVKTTGKISTPFIGVRYIPINDTIQNQNNLPYNYGDLVLRGSSAADLAVIPGSPADKAGIIENDIILEVNGQKISDTGGKSLTDLISQHNVGDTITLKIWRKGAEKNIQVTLEERR